MDSSFGLILEMVWGGAILPLLFSALGFLIFKYSENFNNNYLFCFVSRLLLGLGFTASWVSILKFNGFDSLVGNDFLIFYIPIVVGITGFESASKKFYFLNFVLLMMVAFSMTWFLKPQLPSYFIQLGAAGLLFLAAVFVNYSYFKQRQPLTLNNKIIDKTLYFTVNNLHLILTLILISFGNLYWGSSSLAAVTGSLIALLSVNLLYSFIQTNKLNFFVINHNWVSSVLFLSFLNSYFYLDVDLKYLIFSILFYFVFQVILLLYNFKKTSTQILYLIIQLVFFAASLSSAFLLKTKSFY